MKTHSLTFEADSAIEKDLSNQCVERFLLQCHRRKYPNKSVIIYAGDQPDVLYYVISGSVSVLIEDEDGHEI
ncbi:MAG: cyclic nucleotide-binding domain-containing protein, partial [Gammaproteobacteria bacterium]|nr:cyclic nucleotide-binding domain-containing protein [Gammaproteobacteria bacterium]